MGLKQLRIATHAPSGKNGRFPCMGQRRLDPARQGPAIATDGFWRLGRAGNKRHPLESRRSN